MTPCALAALHQSCFTTPRPWSEVEFTDLLSNPRNLLIPAQTGFALVSIILDEAELLTLAVDPDMRRRGTANDILHRAYAELVKRDVANLFLEVAADNAAALALYDRHGFDQTGQRKGYYSTPGGGKCDAIAMRKILRT